MLLYFNVEMADTIILQCGNGGRIAVLKFCSFLHVNRVVVCLLVYRYWFYILFIP
jgi:hypothetical protein